MTTKELLNKLDKKLESMKSSEKYIFGDEEILVGLLHEYEQKITGLIEQDSSGNWFHKAFRQTDIISGNIDKIIWNLLSFTDIFWDVLSPRDNISEKITKQNQ